MAPARRDVDGSVSTVQPSEEVSRLPRRSLAGVRYLEPDQKVELCVPGPRHQVHRLAEIILRGMIPRADPLLDQRRGVYAGISLQSDIEVEGRHSATHERVLVASNEERLFRIGIGPE